MRFKKLVTFCLLVSIAFTLQSQQTGKDSSNTSSDSVRVDSLELLKKQIKTTNQSTVEIVKRTEKKIESLPSKIENAVLAAQYRNRMNIVVATVQPAKPEPEFPPVSIDSTLKKKNSRGLFKFLKRKK